MHYPSLDACRLLLFPMIRREMASAEPAPDYDNERRGLERMESIFALMQRDEYPDLHTKAAYLFCSVIDGHPFSNGNKRLAVSVLTYFLIMNAQRISEPGMLVLRDELRKRFPLVQWEHVQSFQRTHEYFFYHLAIIIADRKQKGKMTFAQEREAVRQLLLFMCVQS